MPLRQMARAFGVGHDGRIATETSGPVAQQTRFLHQACSLEHGSIERQLCLSLPSSFVKLAHLNLVESSPD
ncbi:hypothetical protein SKAU_G00352650 [Synaphobranchus kaupii]|uniref:Uncharacterized protein n=1 Tax=Synaphobranchus kaupii TaxID=118154 RepID=A0A9Q1EKT1_SYNKA|nr:hypothetical protein SKAU_G00352650 [Synaphobranchus kaupii]